jgi:adenosylcobinamide kinase/adenosylcobinamide-phosphate guanylyltransferase
MAPRVEDRAIDDRTTVQLTAQSTNLAPVTLILGGARSGKSARAESMIESGLGEHWDDAFYIATAQQFDSGANADPEMTARIHDHQARRGAVWTTIEEPLDLPGALSRHGGPRQPVLVDCLTLWLTNTMLSGADSEAATTNLIDGFATLLGPVVFVSNEVGLGIVPDNALAREFRDCAGRLNQRLAAAAQRVEFIAAGLPMLLKNET